MVDDTLLDMVIVVVMYIHDKKEKKNKTALLSPRMGREEQSVRLILHTIGLKYVPTHSRQLTGKLCKLHRTLRVCGIGKDIGDMGKRQKLRKKLRCEVRSILIGLYDREELCDRPLYGTTRDTRSDRFSLNVRRHL